MLYHKWEEWLLFCETSVLCVCANVFLTMVVILKVHETLICSAREGRFGSVVGPSPPQCRFKTLRGQVSLCAFYKTMPIDSFAVAALRHSVLDSQSFFPKL